MYPWLDRTGHFSAARLTAFLLLLLPGIWIAFAWAFATPDPSGSSLLAGAAASATDSMPVTRALREIGLWAVRLLLLTLAVTPFRRIAVWPDLIRYRRMIGVSAFAYVAIHFCLYITQQNFRLGFVANEIVQRFYLSIGFVTLLGLLMLAATSTDGMLRRLGGRRWQLLHYLVYPLAALGLWHFFLQAKINVTEPVLMSGLFIWLMLYRLAYRWHGAGALAGWHLVALAGVAAALTMVGEWAWYETMTTLGGDRLFAANFTLASGLRPTWWVLLAGLAIVLLRMAAERWWSGARFRRQRRGAKRASIA